MDLRGLRGESKGGGGAPLGKTKKENMKEAYKKPSTAPSAATSRTLRTIQVKSAFLILVVSNVTVCNGFLSTFTFNLHLVVFQTYSLVVLLLSWIGFQLKIPFSYLWKNCEGLGNGI